MAKNVFDPEFELLKKNLRKLENLPMKENVTLLIGIDENYGKSALADTLAHNHIQRRRKLMKTVFPRLIAVMDDSDREKNYLLYDMPVIGGDKKLANEITKVFALYKICYYADSFKLAFTLNYSTIKEKNVQQLKDLLEQALLFLRLDDLEKFRNSISLIVTNVNPDAQNGAIKKECTELLEKVQDLLTRNNDEEEKLIKFIGVVSEEDENEKLVNVGIFKNKNQEKDFISLRSLIFKESLPVVKSNEKNIFIEDIFKFRGYQQLFANNSAFNLSSEVTNNSAFNLLETAVEYYINEIKKYFQEIGHKINTHYSEKINNSHDYHQLLEELRHLFTKLQTELTQMQHVHSLLELFEHIKQFSAEIDPNMSSSIAKKILELILRVDAFSRWCKIDYSEIISNEWNNFLKNFEIMINEDKNWLNFLYHYANLLENYEIQKNKDRYFREDCEQMPNSFGYLCKEVSEQFHINFDYTNNVNLTETRKNQLIFLKKELLDKVIKSVQYENNVLTIKGTLIRLSDVPVNDTRYKDVRVLAIYASTKIYLDTNLTLPGVSVIMITPKWEVIGQFGKRQINLDGRRGSDAKEKAADGATPGDNGKDGEPGMPGEPGGNFYGIVEEAVGDNYHLSVSINGGIGGRGGDGGNGRNGLDGGEIGDIEKGICDDRTVQSTNGLEYKKVRQCTGCESSSLGKYCFVGEGRKPTKGGNGGNGGPGGAGGPPGIYEMFIARFQPTFVDFAGTNGAWGSGGIAGKGGKGPTVVCYECKGPYDKDVYSSDLSGGAAIGMLATRIFIGDKFTKKSTLNGSSASAGNPGKTNKKPYYRNDKRDDKNSLYIPYHVENFKSYIRESSKKNYLQRSQFLSFYETLNNDTKIQNLYKAKDHITAVLKLEKQFSSLKNDKQLVLYLYSLPLQSILKYAEILYKEMETKALTEERDQLQVTNRELCNEIKALTHLYSMITMKLDYLTDNKISSIVVDMKSYLDSVTMLITQLEQSKKQVIINNAIENYNEQINEQISEAKTIIQDELMPEIDSSYASITENIDKLVKEVFTMEQNTDKKENELIKKRQELEQQMRLNILFGCLKGISTIISFLGPVGTIVGAVVGVGTQVAENIVAGSNDADPLTLTKGLPDSVQKTLTSMNEYYEKEVKAKCKMWNEELDKIINKTESSAGTTKFVETLKKQKQELNNAVDEGNLRKVNECKKEIKDTLKQENIEVLLDKASKETKTKLKEAIDYFEKAQKVFEHATNIYKQYKSDSDKIKIAEKAISKCESDISKLREYKDQMNNSLMPMMGKMRNDLNHTMNDLQNKSKPRLAFEQYKVQGKLKDMKSLFVDIIISEPTNIQEKLKSCVDKISEVMDTTINIYSQIESYKEQKEMADLIALINTRDLQFVNIEDKELQAAIQELDVRMNENIINQVKVNTLNQFKFYVFPFLKLYFGEFRKSEALDSKPTDINIMKARVTEMEAKANDYHDFRSQRYNDDKPFFVWDNQRYNDQITKLLYLDTVSFFADVTKSPVNQNCIKFKQIGLRFSIPGDKTQQQKLNKLLENFQIKMYHSGVNHFKCKEKYYSFNIPGISIIFNYKTDRDNFTNVNRNYNLLTKHALLSPYTMWTFELRQLKSSNVSFTDLLQYKDNVDLVLVGSGSYIDDESKVCDDLNQYIENVNLTDDSDLEFLTQSDEINQHFGRKRRSIPMNQESSIDRLVNWASNKLEGLVTNSSYNDAAKLPGSGDNNLLTTGSQYSGSNNELSSALHYDVNGSLLLTNYLIRKLTGEKFVHENETQNDIYIDNQVKAMKVTNYVRDIINEILNKNNEIDEAALDQFDPVKLQKKLLSLLNTGRQAEISREVENVAKEILVDDDLEKFHNMVQEILL